MSFSIKNAGPLIVLAVTCFLLSGCSILMKTMVMKQTDKTDWLLNKHKVSASHLYKDDNLDALFFFSDESGHRPLTNYEYYFCDSFSSVSLYCSGASSPLLSGPPVIPVFPLFLIPYKPVGIEFRIVLKTNDDVDISELARYVHFTFNDSANFSEPVKVKTAMKELNYKNKLCSGLTTDKYYSVLYTFNLKLRRMKKVKLTFDNDFNRVLNAGYTTLILKKAWKLSYWMCVIGAF